jgi:hypothetical protein
MAAGDYIPKYKTGYTLLCEGEDTNYIVISTYRGLGEYSHDFSRGHPDYDERDADHVLYALYDPASRSTSWRWEHVVSLYCCNANRGKKILLEPDNLKRISNCYSMDVQGLHRMTMMFMHQPPET